MEIFLVVDAGRESEAAAARAALADAGLEVAAGPPVDAVRLVWAGSLATSLVAVDPEERERWLECTVVVNERPDRVFDLLEEKCLLGALECGDAGPTRLIVRKDVVRHRGERIDAPEAESDGYTEWTDLEAESTAHALASYLAFWRESDTELCISAEEARARKLPPVELRLKLGGTGLVRIPADQAPGYYLVLSSAPGGGSGFFARPALEVGGDLEQIARRMLQNPAGPPLQSAGGIERIRMAGKERESICLFSDWFRFRTASCAVRIEHAGGVVMAIFACPMGRGTPSCEAVLADPALRRIAGSLRVADVTPDQRNTVRHNGP